MNLIGIKRLLQVHGIHPKKSLGQNFTMDSILLKKMINYAGVSKDDVVLEVGAGLGFLTQLLSQYCKRVVAVEIDVKLVEILRERLHGLLNVDLIEGDALTVSIPPFTLTVSNLPYSISSPLLFWLLKRKFDCAVLTFQKEFAQRLAASVGSRDYGRLTVTTHYLAEVELLDYVSRNMFYPPPNVDSMVVRLRPKEPGFFVENEAIFFELVRTLFTQRNRKVKNAIMPFLLQRGMEKENAARLANSIIFHQKRVRELAPEDFGTLSNEFA